MISQVSFVWCLTPILEEATITELRPRPLPPAGGAGGLHHGLAGRRRFAAGLPPTGGGRRPPGHRRRLQVCAGGVVVGVLGTGVRVPFGSGTIAGHLLPPT